MRPSDRAPRAPTDRTNDTGVGSLRGLSEPDPEIRECNRDARADRRCVEDYRSELVPGLTGAVVSIPGRDATEAIHGVIPGPGYQ